MFCFQEIALIITGIGFITSTAFLFGIRLKKDTKRLNNQDTQNPLCVRSTGTGRFCNTSLFKVAAIYTSCRLFINVTIEYMVVYLNETVLSNKETIATIPLTMFTSAAVTSVFINRIFRVNNQKVRVENCNHLGRYWWRQSTVLLWGDFRESSPMIE